MINQLSIQDQTPTQIIDAFRAMPQAQTPVGQYFIEFAFNAYCFDLRPEVDATGLPTGRFANNSSRRKLEIHIADLWASEQASFHGRAVSMTRSNSVATGAAATGAADGSFRGHLDLSDFDGCYSLMRCIFTTDNEYSPAGAEVR